MIKQALEYYNAKFGINQEGATAVEYGIMVALIAVVIIGTVMALGNTLDGVFGEVNTEMGGVAPAE